MKNNFIKILKVLGLYIICLLFTLGIFIINGNLYNLGDSMSRLVKQRLIIIPIILTILIIIIFRIVKSKQKKDWLKNRYLLK